jgi:hypothetical protein
MDQVHVIREGEARLVQIVEEAQARMVRVISEGPPGPAGESAKSYVHQQEAAATTWTINHNLGYRPSAELMDAGSREIDGDVYHPTVNQTVVLFNVPVAGTARLI